jgi:membrane protease YdiL (CAAX protease family)
MSRATSSSARSASGAAANPASTRARGPKPVRGYFARSELPLVSLAFLLPFIVLYEVGTWQFASDPVRQTEQRIIAFNLMQDFFRLFGATGRYLPAMAVVLILICWHVARQDPWRVEPRYLLGMPGESLLLSLPLLGIGFVATHYLDHYLPLMVARQTAGLVVLSVGAGIYEELVFRLIAFTVLSFVLVDLLGMKRGWAGLLMVVLSSLLFSLYHYLGPEQFDIRTFAFRTAAGAYFGAVFVFRGFGITAGAHAAYDIFIVALRALV